MTHGVSPAGQSPPWQPFLPPRSSVPPPGRDEAPPRLDAGERSGTRSGFMVDAGRRMDAFAASVALTEDQAQKFDAASEGFLKAVAAIRSERLGSLQTAQRTQLALEKFAVELDRLPIPGGGDVGTALTALVSELQRVFDAAFEQAAGQEQAPQIFFPAFDGHGSPSDRLLTAYRSQSAGRGLPPDSSLDTVA